MTTPGNSRPRLIASLMLGVVVVMAGTLSALAQTPPLEDVCLDALLVVPGNTNSGQTVNIDATNSTDDPDLSCAMGPGFGSVFFEFDATHTSARIRTDLNSAGQDADFGVYAVDQFNQCDTQAWAEVGCAEDDDTTLSGNTDTCIEGLIIGETYKIMLSSFTAGSSGDYTLQVDGPCTSGVPAVCGNGFIDDGEQCDDGNTADGDSCSAICEITTGGGGEEPPADTEDPVISAPANINVNTDAGLATAVVNFPDATATDNVGVVTLIQTAGPASGSAFPIGLTVVTWTATDAAGNQASASTNITVTDNEDPVISAPGNIVAEASSAAGAVVDFPFATATDNSGGAIVTQTAGPASGSTFPLGPPTTVSFKATDPSGNMAQASFTVTVTDTTAPVVMASADVIDFEATGPQTTVVIGTATATDAVGVVSLTSNAPATFPVGLTIVTWTATDAAGNSDEAMQNVTVTDNTAPVVTAPADQIVNTEPGGSTAVVNFDDATATDNVGVVTLEQTAGPASGTAFPLGLTVVTWTATDAAGNQAQASTNITVNEDQDADPPVVTAPEDMTVEATGSLTPVAIGTATATDNVGVTSLTNDAPASFPIGTTVVTWTATDAAGNIGTATQNVTLVYIFGQFLPPLEDGKIYKANRTLPVKFQISFVGGIPVEEATVGIQVVMIGADDTLGEPIDLSTNETADTGSVFRFTDGQYIFNLPTKGFAPGKYRITAVLSNGQMPFIDIVLR